MTRTLEAADYWKLRALCSEAIRCDLIARQALADRATAQQKQDAALTALGLEARTPTFTLDDDTLTITVPDPPPERTAS